MITGFWNRIEARDWPGVADLLDADVVLDWPASRERIVGAAHVVAVNAEYPEGWTVRVLRVVGDDRSAASEVEVTSGPDAPVSRSAAFWTVADGRIVRGVEYWTEVGQDPAPQWRAAYTRPLDAGLDADPGTDPGADPGSGGRSAS